MNRILYVLTSDGSDVRTIKEIQTLTKKNEVYFLGLGNNNYNNNNPAAISSICQKYILVGVNRNSILNILKFIFKFISIVLTKKIKVVHLVNENLVVYFYPFLFFKPVILDLYDSFFLRFYSLNKFDALKYFIYLPINKIIVTDETRFNLMPEKTKSKCFIIPNVPCKSSYIYPPKEKNNDVLRIAFTGALTKTRGSQILLKLCDLYPENISIIMAGWINDDETKKLLEYKNVEYRGVLPQHEVYKFIITECDYIFSVYSPHNRNNIYASPNKLFDAIHTKTPIIINKEVKVCSFVTDNNIGYVMDSFFDIDYKLFYENLQKYKDHFFFSDQLIEKNSWEKYETELLEMHLF